jgi:hypothetical protein
MMHCSISIFVCDGLPFWLVAMNLRAYDPPRRTTGSNKKTGGGTGGHGGSVRVRT